MSKADTNVPKMYFKGIVIKMYCKNGLDIVWRYFVVLFLDSSA